VIIYIHNELEENNDYKFDLIIAENTQTCAGREDVLQPLSDFKRYFLLFSETLEDSEKLEELRRIQEVFLH